MFDDYHHKFNYYFEFKFRQRKDERILPWEMAGFINNFNTLYYKNDLLNSISSSILRGISPKDIFIFDGTLPLNKKYLNLNLLDESNLANYFYNVGKPYSIWPSQDTYRVNFLYQIFHSINSLLLSRRFQPLRVNNLTNAIKVLNASKSTEEVIEFLSDIAVKSSELSHEKNSKNYSDRTPLTREEIKQRVKKIVEKQERTLEIIREIEEFSDDTFISKMSSKKKDDAKYKREINKFYDTFFKVNRPVVCARVGNGKIRVLARALVNKSSFGALELKEAKKNSPAEFIFLGLPAAIKTGIDIKHTMDLHKLDMQIKAIELEKAKIELEKSKVELNSAKEDQRKRAAEANLAETEAEMLHQAHAKSIEQSDLKDFERLPDSATKRNLAIAYGTMDSKVSRTIQEYGINYVDGSFKPISIKA